MIIVSAEIVREESQIVKCFRNTRAELQLAVQDLLDAIQFLLDQREPFLRLETFLNCRHGVGDAEE